MAAGLVLCAGALQLALPAALAGGGEIAAVSSKVSADYSRVKLADGSYQHETYTFGEGGHLAGPSHDETMDDVTFLDVAKVVAEPLRKKNYIPVEDRNPENTKLLIMVYWGTTAGTSDASNSLAYQNLERSQGSHAPPTPPPSSGANSSAAAAANVNLQVRQNSSFQTVQQQSASDGAMAAVLAENWQRDQADMKNAMLLGYDTALAELDDVGATPQTRRRDDMITDIEESRYFVVLMAYDYQALWTQKKHRLLWVTRFSVRARGADFEKLLPSMVASASQYFGQDSHGLLRRPLPEGHVEIGEPKSLGTVP
jgi:hypothetical protein